MHFWRSLLRIFFTFCFGFAIATVLHACQSNPNAVSNNSPVSSTATTTPAAKPVEAKPKNLPLPPATKAIVDSVKPNGLYNPARGDVRLVVISDLNSAYGSTDYESEVDTAITLLPFWQPDLVVCGGDMVAGQNSSLTTEQLQAMWAAFDSHIAAPLRQAKLPFGFTLGNHDASSARSEGGKFFFDRERKITSSYWNEPEHNPGIEFVDRKDFPFYYTFKQKDVFFLVWDGSSDFIPKDKLDWVEKAFQSPEAQSAKLKILIGHLPLYAVAEGRNNPGNVMADADRLRAMLERNNVHTYISGHHHAYYPAHKGKLQLLHTGLLGAGPRPYINSSLRPRKTLTVMDISFSDSDITTYTTYDMQTMQLIKYEELPRFISGHNGMVLRRDVKMGDLSKSEISNCASSLGVDLCRA